MVIDEYHCAKTASLFSATAAMGAIAAGADAAPWRFLIRAWVERVAARAGLAQELVEA